MHLKARPALDKGSSAGLSGILKKKYVLEGHLFYRDVNVDLRSKRVVR